jgi:hypothetical protein
MATEAQTCAIGIIANRRNAQKSTGPRTPRPRRFPPRALLHVYPKQSQFAGYSNDRRFCYNKVLWTWTPSQTRGKQSQSNPIKPNQTQSNPIKPNLKTCTLLLIFYPIFLTYLTWTIQINLRTLIFRLKNNFIRKIPPKTVCWQFYPPRIEPSW